MKNKNLETAALLLGTTVETLNSFEQQYLDEMSAAVEMLAPVTEEQTLQLHGELHDIWERAGAHQSMIEISKETGADLGAMLSLDVQSQLMIYWDYCMALSDGDVKRAVSSVYENISRSLAIIELPDVAKLLGIEYDKIRLYSREVWEQLCGAYAMEYDEDGDNSELIDELKKILDEAEETKDE